MNVSDIINEQESGPVYRLMVEAIKRGEGK